MLGRDSKNLTKMRWQQKIIGILKTKKVKLTKIIKKNYLQAKDISILYDFKKLESEINRNEKNNTMSEGIKNKKKAI